MNEAQIKLTESGDRKEAISGPSLLATQTGKCSHVMLESLGIPSGLSQRKTPVCWLNRAPKSPHSSAVAASSSMRKSMPALFKRSTRVIPMALAGVRTPPCSFPAFLSSSSCTVSLLQKGILEQAAFYSGTQTEKLLIRLNLP